MTAIQPHEMSRELKLKLALARLLSDDIEVTELCNFRWRRGRWEGQMVCSNEWEEVLNMVLRLGYPWHEKAEKLLNVWGIEWDTP